jgi:CO/xanthine dehydrogenase Mo-binding subunit
MIAHSQLSRRHVLKAGGALIVSLAAAQGGLPGEAKAAALDPKHAGSWIAIHADNTATVYLGKVELGQGNGTTLLQMVADELDLDLSQVSAAAVDTQRSMNQGATVSSSSIQVAGLQLRAAAAELRHELLQRAARRFNTPVELLKVDNGRVSGGTTQSITYGALIGEGTTEIPLTGKAPQKKPSDYKWIGRRVARRDIPAKIKGTYTYMQQVSVPGMLHGRVVRPGGQSAYGHAAKIVKVDESSIADLKNVRVIRKGDFLGVVAPRQWDAIRAADRLKVQWDIRDTLPGAAALHDKMRNAKTDDTTMLADGDVGKAAAVHMASGTFRGPYQAHAPFGPSCAIADVTADRVTVKCSSQDVFALRDRTAALVGLPNDKVQVQYFEGSGCFGHSCHDDVALAAALLSQAAGKPVRVQFSRADEMGWDNYGPAHQGEVKIGADQNGKIVSYEYHGWHHGWMMEESTEELANKPVRELAKGPGSLFVNKFVAGGMYDIPNRLLVNHAVAGLDGYLKGANLRAPMDLHYAFASEQLIDQLAAMAKLDPVEFRRRNIKDPRWRGVLEAAAEAAKWQKREHPPQAVGATVAGRGVALGTHRAAMGGAVADIEVNRSTGSILVKHIFAVMDCGTAINPGIVESQIVGMSIQATSRVLMEAVEFSKKGVTSLDWVSYPILRFADHPAVTPIIVPRNDPPLGAGEEVLPAVGAAIANALFDATGKRLMEYPMTPERVLAVLRR